MYAEIYFDDLYCDNENERNTQESSKLPVRQELSNVANEHIEDWKSPSDHLIGLVNLRPPFTFKITKGITHKGILAFGNEVVENERARFLKHVTNLIHENDAAWNYILEHEKTLVSKKVNEIYEKIFLTKSKIMTEEIDKFYEIALQEIEAHLKLEIQNVLIHAHAAIICDLNTKIREKMQIEKKIVENILKKRYESEIHRVKKYYNILISHELFRINKLINNDIMERNDALKLFYRQLEAENMTSTMYIMSTERKKCRIKKFILNNYHSTEIAEKLQNLKQRQDLIDAFKKNERYITDINKEWEEKIKKILRLFLKFISFALKLLPEQTTFLLDLEKMVVLQLNEIQKVPINVPCSILVDEKKVINVFKFEEPVSMEVPCIKKPIMLVGDMSDPISPKCESRETLQSDVDLPTITLDKQYVYAKCHQFEEIKTLLESQICKCLDTPIREPSHEMLPSKLTESIKSNQSTTSESSDELLLVQDIRRFDECPARHCNNWTKRTTFPYLNSYLDFTEDNFERVQTILGNEHIKGMTSELISTKDIAHKSLPFGSTNDVYRHAETQYSSQENIYTPDVKCSCIEVQTAPPKESHEIKETTSKYFDDILKKRKISLRRIIQHNPKLLNMFTDESFDFVL